MSKNKDIIHLESLEKFSVLTSNDLFYKKCFLVWDKKNKKKKKIQAFNLIATCIIRIRETSEYLNALDLKKENLYREAFSFYEFINCISIIYGCTESLFSCFGLDIKKEYGNKRVFKKSNGKKTIDDIKFFRFIRSASSVHPQETTNFNKVISSEREYFPYAVWRNEIDVVLFKEEPKDYDVRLVSWNSKPDCYSRHYYLVSDEFLEFADYIVSLISKLIPLVVDIIDAEKEKLRCKRLKNSDSFSSKKDYCLYLRSRLFKKKTNKHEFADGGLLIASHIVQNDLLSQEFKNYIFGKVESIANQMTVDLTEIGFDDVTCGLSLYDCLKDNDSRNADYVSEKFHNYLENEAKREIETGEFLPFRIASRYETNNCDYSDAEWAARLLLTRTTDFYDIKKIEQAYSFADLYEITLETIWKKKQGDNKNARL